MNEDVTQVESEELPAETNFQMVRTKATYIVGFVLFFFPFINIQCVHQGESYTITQSGLQIALGGTTSDFGGERKWTLTGQRGEPWMMAYGIFSLFAVAFAVMIHRRILDGKDELALSLACVVCLVVQFVVLDDYRSLLGKDLDPGLGRVECHYTVFLYLSFLTHLCGVCFAWSTIRKLHSETETEKSSRTIADKTCSQFGDPNAQSVH